MNAGRGRRLSAALVMGLALTTAACSGGGSGPKDPVAEGNFGGIAGEKILQFTGAAKVGISGTLAMPTNGSGRGAPPGVLIVPGPGLTNRDGRTVGAPIDSLYKDLSKAFTAAGMATFRYDHRGAGASTLESGQQPTWDDMVADAQAALKYFGERGEIDGSHIAVVGHDMGGQIALKLAAADPRVKSVALVAVAGRPLVDVWAGEFQALSGKDSADAFRSVAAQLASTGALPPRDGIRAEHQTVLPVGQDALYRSLFSVDPLADAPGVKVPVIIAFGEKSTSVHNDDADLLSRRLGGTSEVVVAPNSSATLQTLKPAPRLVPGGDPSDMSSMGGGPIIADAPRDKPSVERIAAFLAASVGAHPA